jgi:hypothetical protein
MKENFNHIIFASLLGISELKFTTSSPYLNEIASMYHSYGKGVDPTFHYNNNGYSMANDRNIGVGDPGSPHGDGMTTEFNLQDFCFKN